MWFARKWLPRQLEAPVLMLIHTPRYMGPPQWSDIGMWMQTVMLLLREEGLDSCAQEAWAIYSEQIRHCVEHSEDGSYLLLRDGDWLSRSGSAGEQLSRCPEGAAG